jgi:hypothetical protein
MNQKIIIGISLLIIVLLIVGFFAYSTTTSNPSDNTNSSALGENLNTTSKEASNTTVNNTVNFNEINNSTTSELDSSVKNQCKNVLETYLKLLSCANGAPTSIFSQLGFSYELDNTKKGDDYNYILSEIKYKDFENEMLKYMTKDQLEKIVNPEQSEGKELFKNSNGFVSVLDVGASGKEYSIKNMSLVSSNDTNSSFYVETIYTTGEYQEEENFTASFKLVDELWVVSEIAYNN